MTLNVKPYVKHISELRPSDAWVGALPHELREVLEKHGYMSTDLLNFLVSDKKVE